MFNTKITMLVAVLLLSITALSAQKFGYINSQELIQELPEVKEANSNIEAFQSQLQRKGQEMIQSLQAKYQEIERTKDQFSPVQLEAEGQKLKAEENKILEFEQSSQQKILEKSETLLQPIRQKIETAINDVANENGYTYIFDYSLGFVLYADASTNIGPLVKAKLGL